MDASAWLANRRAADTDDRGAARLAEGTVALLVLLLPFTLPIYIVLDPADRPDQNSMVFYPVDIGLALIVGLALPVFARSVRRWTLSRFVALMVLFTCLNAVSATIHGGVAGVQFTLRLAAVSLLLHVVIELRVRVLSGVVLYACVVVGVEQSLLAAAQSATGGPLGLVFLGLGDSASVTMPTVGGLAWPRGTLWYPYMLSGFSVLLTTLVLARTISRRRGRAWLFVATSAVAVPIGLTYSRTALLSLMTILVVLLVSKLPWATRAAGAAAVSLGASTSALLTLDGWIARGEETVANTATAGGLSADGLSTGRITFIREAWHLIQASPVFGVGPGKYMEALLKADIASPELRYPVHNVPLLAATESGILAGFVLSAFLTVLGAAALRRGAATLVIYGGLMPFLLLDVIPYRTPQGIVMFGLWAGAILTSTERGPVSHRPLAKPDDMAASRRMASDDAVR